MDHIFGLFHHLALCDPEGGFGDGGGEIVDLDAVELVDGDLDGVQHPHDDLVLEEQGEDFVFQAAEGEVAFREEVTGTAGGVQEGQAGQLGLIVSELGGAGLFYGDLFDLC